MRGATQIRRARLPTIPKASNSTPSTPTATTVVVESGSARAIWTERVPISIPRSNTTRRNVFQDELALAFLEADVIVVAEVARLESLPPESRLNPEKLIQDIAAGGKSAHYVPKVDAIVSHVAKEARGGDVICVFSNGGFGDLHSRLLKQLDPKSR